MSSGSLTEQEKHPETVKKMARPNDRIININAADHGQASGVLKRAFDDDPLWMHIHQSKTRSDKVLLWFYRTVVRYGLIFGRPETTPDLEGVAVWSKPGVGPVSYWQLFRVGLFLYPFKMGLESFSRFADCIDTVEKAHNQYMHQDHWYLIFLGVDPQHQCKGIGSALIRSVTREADEKGLPCYLEASTQRSRDLYMRHGFKVNQEMRLPKGGPPIWSMTRGPAT